MAKKTKNKKKSLAQTLDKHLLYEASVQCVEVDYDFFQRVFRTKRKRRARTLREDFCGTAILACEWVRRHKENRAWGVDLDQPTLDWAGAHRVSHLTPDAARRLKLIHGDACTVRHPKVDVVCALNFSFSVIKERAVLVDYFKKVHQSLNKDGLCIIDTYGGPGAMEITKDKRKIKKDVDYRGEKHPTFRYTWEQAEYNSVNNHTLCHIHFRFSDGSKLLKAFTYDWRLWHCPELCDILRDAGFKTAEPYLEGWDDEADDTDGHIRRRTHCDEMHAWVGYIVAEK